MGKKAIRRIIPLPFGAFIVMSVDLESPILAVQLYKARLSNPLPLLKAQGAVLRQEARARFAEGGQPAWQRLAASTIAAKTLAGLPMKTKKGNIPYRLKQRGAFGGADSILIRTGALRDSWGLKNDRNHIEVYDEKACSVTIGSKLPYADFHQNGTSGYTIMAKAGKALAFTGSGGEMLFRKSVKHPGLPRRAVLVSQDGIERMRALTVSYLEGELNLLSEK